MSQVRAERNQRREDILAAARAVFCEKGYEHAAVAEIAARVGVVEGTLYRYFDSKRALLIAVLHDWYQSLFSDTAEALAGVRGAQPRLRLLIWRHLRTIRDAPDLCRLMFREARDDVGEINAELRLLNRRYTRFLSEVLDEGIAEGVFRPDLSGPLLRDLVFGGIEHYCWRYLCGQGELDIDTAADEISALFSHGILAPSASSEAQQLSGLVQRLEQLIPQLPSTSQ